MNFAKRPVAEQFEKLLETAPHSHIERRNSLVINRSIFSRYPRKTLKNKKQHLGKKKKVRSRSLGLTLEVAV